MNGIRIVSFIGWLHFALALSRLEYRQTTNDSEDSPLYLDRSHYIYRKWHRSIAVGNYLYIDGGEIEYTDADNQTTHVSSVNTYSIDLTTSWTNATISPKKIDKAIDGRNLCSPDLWPGLDNASFYSYNGDESWWYTPSGAPPNKLYRFTADGAGGGQWSEDEDSYTPNSHFADLVRVGGTGAACGLDTCYAIGGFQNSRTTSGFPDPGIGSSGVVSYNFTSHMWHNDTMVGAVFQGPWSGRDAFYTNIAGSEGILIILGGQSSNLAATTWVSLSLGYIYLYDIASKTWYQQSTSGDVPPLRASFCTVGKQGDGTPNKTFEIFLHGGSSSDGNNIAFDDVWVLSLPSFQWHKAGDTPVRARTDHWCSIVGQRQMVLTGGWDPDSPDSPDLWPLGLGIFDLSELKFMYSYNASAATYTSPDVVKQWYVENGPISTSISDEVKLLSTGPPTNGSTGPSALHSGHQSNTAAIVGGVVGAVAVVLLVVGVWWYYRRRARPEKGGQTKHEHQTQNTGRDGLYEVVGNPIYGEETAGTPVYEKESQLRQHELYGRESERYRKHYELHSDQVQCQ